MRYASFRVSPSQVLARTPGLSWHQHQADQHILARTLGFPRLPACLGTLPACLGSNSRLAACLGSNRLAIPGWRACLGTSTRLCMSWHERQAGRLGTTTRLPACWHEDQGGQHVFPAQTLQNTPARAKTCGQRRSC